MSSGNETYMYSACCVEAHRKLTIMLLTTGDYPPDLTLPVTLTGVKQPTTITLERKATADMFGKPEQEVGKLIMSIEQNNWSPVIMY